jgi:hypothetical protein
VERKVITVLLWAILVLCVLTFAANVAALVVTLRRNRKPRYPTNVKPPRKAR